MIKFLAVTDMHYSDKIVSGDRHHSRSVEKLRTALKNSADGCDFIMNLGDTADELEGYQSQEAGLKDVFEAFSAYPLPLYTIIGNHDTSAAKEALPAMLKIPDRYYSFDIGGFRCIVLDANMNSPDEPMTQKEIDWDYCFIDPVQKQWLVEQIESTDARVLIFCHELFMLHNRETQNGHLIINRGEFVEMFEKYDNVKAVFAGHYHDGEFVVAGNVPYITFSSMCIDDEITYAVVTVNEQELSVKGFGNQHSFDYKF